MASVINFLFALFLLVLFSPLFLILSILIIIFLGRPILFKQPRVGYKEKIFTLYKFRTMNQDCDPAGVLLSDAQRLTRFGKFLRATSLDELPQLLNILKGDMNFIGPRPLLVDYLPLYSLEQKRRHSVHPGITGWAQVNGRNSISWADKFKLDCWYVDHQSLGLDLRILGLTFLRVCRRSDINQQGQATVEKFDGHN